MNRKDHTMLADNKDFRVGAFVALVWQYMLPTPN